MFTLGGTVTDWNDFQQALSCLRTHADIYVDSYVDSK